MLGLVASGDRSVWSASGGNLGIDPLEILNLAVRANAIFVLDSSGSMGETAAGTGGLADDDPDTKIAIAKKVIRDIISVNQTKVSFQFGQYDQGRIDDPDQYPDLPERGEYPVPIHREERHVHDRAGGPVEALRSSGRAATGRWLSRTGTRTTPPRPSPPASTRAPSWRNRWPH